MSQTAEPPPGRQEPLSDPIRVDIFHFNDFHRRLEPSENGTGGAARLASLIRQQRQEHPESLLLNGGDIAGDNTVPGPDAFEPLAQVFNEMGVDVMTLGNHEFEDPEGGYSSLKQGFVAPFAGEVVLANVETADGRPFEGTKPYTIRTLKGINVAVIGVVCRDLSSSVHPAAGAGLHVSDLAWTLEENARQARLDGADAVVALVHDGLNDTKALAREVEGVDLFLAAHDHRITPQPEHVEGPEGPAWVAEAGGYGQNLGHSTILVDPDTRKVVGVEGRMLPVTPDLPRDPEVQAIVDGYERPERMPFTPTKRRWESVSLGELKARLYPPTEDPA